MASQAREAARKARELTRRKRLWRARRCPASWPTAGEGPGKCEIYIVEGDSAGGSAKQGRTAHPGHPAAQGKILNVEKARLDKILENEEIRALITAFGTGVGEEFDLDKARYHKIIMMTDADVDGAHIWTLLLTFFYRYMQPLVEAGYVYIAQPPLYKVKKGKKEIYVYNEKELATAMEEMGRRRRHPAVQRSGRDEPRAAVGDDHGPGDADRAAGDDGGRGRGGRDVHHLMGDEVEPRRDSSSRTPSK